MNDYTEVLENNAFNKIMKKIEIIKTKDIFFGFNKMEKINNSIYRFTCSEHGDYILDGRLIRELNLKKDFSCPNCNNPSNKNKNRIEKFETLSINDRLTYMSSLFNELDWNDLDKSSFQNIDHTIRPACPEHGEILTTSRKLLNGENCKWCDGIKEDSENGDYYLESSRERFLYEKLSFYKPELFNPDTKLIYQDKNTFFIQSENKKDRINISCLKGNPEYKKHLKDVRTPENWNSIFFKLNIVDKSTKFRFSLVYYIELNETWINWYKNKILEIDDQEIAQREVTNKLISTWVNLVISDSFDFEIQWSFWSNKKRVVINYNWYRIKNKEKEMLLPDSLLSKLKLNLSQYNIPCYWSEIKWDTTSTNIPMIRESLGKKTNICPICKNILTKPVIDHEHKKKVKGTGRIRDSICSNCNVFIAKVENNCKRYNINLEELPEVLKNISEYFTTQQYNMIHYTDKDSRPTLSKTLANKVIKYWEYLYPGKRKKLRYPKSGIITKDWEDALLILENFEKQEKLTFSKLDYKNLLKEIESYNNRINIENIGKPKTKKRNLILIPEYPKLKLITPEIQRIMDIINPKG
jgi:hypothetical protein